MSKEHGDRRSIAPVDLVNGARFRRELAESPEVAARQEAALARPLRALAARLRSNPPQVVVTCARGSSAHAATFAKHLIEHRLGIPVAEATPGIVSVYGRALHLKGQFFLAISQSGCSDDLIENAHMARRAGALTACLVNNVESPLAGACDIVLPIAAGAEISVAATKTFVASLAGLLRLVAKWTEDAELSAAIGRLPQRLAAASALDWRAVSEMLVPANSAIMLGRGPTLAIAREAALKLKEVALLHAEAFSGAEFLHGPIALAQPGYPILMFMSQDPAEIRMHRLAAQLEAIGASVSIAAPSTGSGNTVKLLPADHPDTDPLCQIQAFYQALAGIAARRGIDPDEPRNLQKVTSTR